MGWKGIATICFTILNSHRGRGVRTQVCCTHLKGFGLHSERFYVKALWPLLVAFWPREKPKEILATQAISV